MKWLLIQLLLLFFVTTVTFAQSGGTGAVKGKVLEAANLQPVAGATISILKAKDSAAIAHSISRADGSFFLEKLPLGSYLLQVTFQGYTPVSRNFGLTPQSRLYDAGLLPLSVLAKELETIVIRSVPPVSVKGDTTEFNAGSFKTKPNATAEDLLKKIPGIEVDKEGGIQAQGEPVTKVMIDGKLFFGNDARMATQNLPTDIIDKMQIIDAQSDQSAFTGFDDGTQQKVINIVTKKNRRKGYFGKGNLAVGSDGRYGADISLNRFNGDRKISLVGKANNTNLERYSISDILEIINSGGFGALDHMGRSGMASTYGGGLNYIDVYGAKTQVSGNYRYNNVNQVDQSSRLRETFVAGDSSIFNNNLSYGNSRNLGHNASFEIEHKFDSSTSILLKPSFSRNRNNNYNETNSSLTRGKSLSQKDVRTINNSLRDGFEYGNSVLLRHGFAKKGRTASVYVATGTDRSHTDRTAFNYTRDYSGASPAPDTTNRISDIDQQTNRTSFHLSYTEPISARSILELKYEFDKDRNLSDQQTNTFNRLTRKYDLADTILSNNFHNIDISQQAGAHYRIQLSEEWNYTMGVDMEKTEVNSDNRTKNNFLSQTFRNFIPSASLQYRKKRKANFRLDYRGSTRQPDIAQLQDVVDNTNLLSIKRGNPSLKQEFTNNFNFRFTKINAAKSRNLIVRLSGELVNNKISNAITINTLPNKIMVDNVELEPLARYSKPVNLNGAYAFKGYLNYGFALKKWQSNMNVSTSLTHSRDASLVNDVKGYTRNYSIRERIRLTTNIAEWFDLNFASSSTFNRTQNTLRPELNRNYFTQELSLEPTFVTSSNWIIAGEFEYTKRAGQAAGFNQSIPLLNASVSRQLFGKKQGELKVSVFDLLNENKSISRTVEENYIEDVRTNVLQRYFLLSFIYNFKSFGR